jgi:transketolase
MKDLNEVSTKKLYEIANEIRKIALKMIYTAGAGHPGGSLSIAEIIAVLYFREMRIDPKNPKWEERDRLVLSKGHAAPALYAALAMRGFFEEKYLMTFDSIDSILQGHPDMTKTPGVDMSTGSLGQGLSAGIGMALGAKLLNKDFKTYVILGDGECEEGQVWEAAMSASKYKLDNLIAIIDYNNVQLVGNILDVMPLEPFSQKWESFGWNSIIIDGHDVESIIHALELAKKSCGKPTVIIARTIKGKGVSFMEGKYQWHSKAPNSEEFELAMSELESFK